MASLQVAEQARQHRVARLVFTHIGRLSLRAIKAACRLPFGEWGEPGRTYQLPPQTHDAARHARLPALRPPRPCQRAQIDPFGVASKVMGTTHHNVPNGGCARGVGRPILTGSYGNGGQPPYDPDSCRAPAAVTI
jgi:hypothetical protein